MIQLVSIFINHPKLGIILGKIEMNPNLKQRHSSKWHEMVNFLHSNTNLKIMKVTKTSSLGKKTAHRGSDMDVIFFTSQDQAKRIVINELYEKAPQNFTNSAEIKKGTDAINVDFYNPPTKIDLVYLYQNDFNKENKEFKNLKQIFPHQKDVIKIVKYAFDTFLSRKFNGHKVEKACKMFNCSDVGDCVHSIVNYFRGRLNEKRYRIGHFLNTILNYL